MMDIIDAKVFALIAGGTLFFVEFLKKLLPSKITPERATQIAAILPIVFTIGAKAAGLFHGTEWVDALLWALGGGVGAGVGHDKVWNPLMGVTKSALGKITSFLPKPPPSQ